MSEQNHSNPSAAPQRGLTAKIVKLFTISQLSPLFLIGALSDRRPAGRHGRAALDAA